MDSPYSTPAEEASRKPGTARSRWSDGIYRLGRSRGGFALAIAPAVVLYLLLLVLPMLYLGQYSFYERAAGAMRAAKPFTLVNYLTFVTDLFYLNVLGGTLVRGVVVVLICLALGYPVAWGLARAGRYKGLLYVVVLASLFISHVVKVYAWMIVLSTEGALNWVLGTLGLGKAPPLLYNEAGVIIGMTHGLLPFMIIVLESVMRQIDRSYLDAARALGANDLRVIKEIVWPLSLPGVIAGSLLVFSLAVSIFTTPALMGGGKVELMSTLIYTRTISLMDWSFAAAASWILLLTTLALTAIYQSVVARYRWRAA